MPQATSKRCFKCGETKVITEFYVHPQMGDGRLNKCKACTKRDVSENYRANVEHYTAYERERFQDPERKRKLADYRVRRPVTKRRANWLTSNAIRDGRLTRQPCEKCGDEAEAHHDDYSKPLEVRWLCRKHHLEHHGKVSRVA